MSKYIKRVALGDIQWLRIYHNTRRVTLGSAMRETGADYGFNGGLYNGDWSLCGHVKADGRVLASETWGCWGFAWNDGPDIKLVALPEGGRDYRNYMSGTELLTPMVGAGDKPIYGKELGGVRGRRAEGLTGEALVFYASQDGADGATLEGVQTELYRMGCESAIADDGGQSVKARTRDGAVAFEAATRPITASYILLKLKEGGQEPPKEDKPVGKKFKVCLDAGHGVETAGKCAPDKSYYEHEFNLDMAKRQKVILERHGVEVIMTRTDTHDVSLEKRVQIANAAGVDLFVSDHSNASGDGLSWTSPDGYGIYTSAAGATANRNIAAGKLIARAKEVGIKLWGSGLFHEAWYVCKNAVAPAILIEHGFHTNKAETAKLKTDAYRQQLAVVDCKGILDYLGIQWQDEPAKEPEKPTDDRQRVKERFGLDDYTLEFLGAYKYGADLLRKLATAK